MKKIILLSLVLGLVGCESKEEKQARLNLVVKSFSEEIVKQDLIDPSSAMFSNQKGFCGEVNSKNRMGGYVGKTRYIVLNNKTVLFEDENNIANQQFPRAWSEICNQQPKFNDKDELIPPNFKIPEPKYKDAEYHFSAKHATATPSSLTVGEGFKYIYPILRLGCEDGVTSISLWSQRHLSYTSEDYVFVKTDKTTEAQPIKVRSEEDWQDFGENEELVSLIKSANKLEIFFKTSDGGISLQEFNLVALKAGMRKQNNACGWNKF